MTYLKCLVLLLFLGATSFLQAQEINQEKKRYAIDKMSNAEIIKAIDEGQDLTELLYKDGEYEATFFQIAAHAYGYYCRDNRKEAVYYMISKSEGKIKEPLFFLVDACEERISDILEYYDFLLQHSYRLDSKHFKAIRETYYDDYEDERWNHQNEKGRTILMYAAKYGYLQELKYILRKKAAVNLKDHEGKTALIYAMESGDKNIVIKLLKAGADPKIKDKSGKTATDYTDERSLKKILRKKKYRKK